MATEWSQQMSVTGVQAGGVGGGKEKITKKGAYRGTIIESDRIVAKSSGKEIVVITARCEEDGEFHGIEVGIPLGLDMSNKGNPRSWATLLRTILPASSHAQLEVGPVNVTSKGLIGKPIFFFVTADAQTEKNADGTWAKDPYINLLLASEYNSYKSGKPMGAHATGAQTSTSANNGTNGASTPEVASPFSI